MSGKHICSYVITAQYDGKKPFCIGTFHVEKGRTEQETEEAAGHAAVQSLLQFYDKHMRDGMAPPSVIGVRLGAIVFVPAEARQ